VASSEALDVLQWAMRPALHRRIRMVIEIASNLPAFLCHRRVHFWPQP
jgi:hypothetical protein